MNITAGVLSEKAAGWFQFHIKATLFGFAISNEWD